MYVILAVNNRWHYPDYTVGAVVWWVKLGGAREIWHKHFCHDCVCVLCVRNARFFSYVFLVCTNENQWKRIGSLCEFAKANESQRLHICHVAHIFFVWKLYVEQSPMNVTSSKPDVPRWLGLFCFRRAFILPFTVVCITFHFGVTVLRVCLVCRIFSYAFA